MDSGHIKNKRQKVNQLPPGFWVGSLYFIEGLPYTLVNSVSVAVFKTMQVTNSQIGLYTSLLYIPWIVKFIWAPVVNFLGRLRSWILAVQIILSALAFTLSLMFLFAPSFLVLIAIFALMALASATYDIACDGYYLTALSKEQQALYVGWRNAAYKMAWIFGSGALVYLAGQIVGNNTLINMLGKFFHNLPNINIGWFAAFFLTGVVFLLAFIFHLFQLPESSVRLNQNLNEPAKISVPHTITSQDSSSAESITEDNSEKDKGLSSAFADAFTSFFQQDKIALILVWILIFRAGDALLLKMAQPFFLDSRMKGGLGLSLSEVGFVYGSVGLLCLLAGGIVGSWLVFKYGLRKCLMPTALLQSVTLLLYWLLAIYQPALASIALSNAFEQFAYGLATTAYTCYLFTIVKKQFLTSHYAIATGFMAIGIMLPGAVSGYLVDCFGYKQFFLISFFCSLPGILCTTRLPFRE